MPEGIFRPTLPLRRVPVCGSEPRDLGQMNRAHLMHGACLGALNETESGNEPPTAIGWLQAHVLSARPLGELDIQCPVAK